MIPLPVLKVARNTPPRLRAGHPWIYANELAPPSEGTDAGSLVDVQTKDGVWIGRGYYNPASVIAVRLLTRVPVEIDAAFVAGAIDRAQAVRETVMPGEEAYRLVFGEADGLPGLIVDRYGSVLVAQVLTAGMERLTEQIVDALVKRFQPTTIIARNDTGSRQLEGLTTNKRVLYGARPDRVVVTKNGLTFEVDVWEGQKTGLFLDQSENYRALASWAPSARVLDAFCYAGAWGLYALRSGAASVLGLDASDRALAAARTNAALNGFSEPTEYRRVDVFDELRRLRDRSARYEVVVLDPPSFAKTRKDLPQALRGYREINRLGMSLLAPGGLLVTCSCSHPIDEARFHDMLVDAASDAKRTFRLVERRSQSRDHPIILGIPETEYLRCAFLQDLQDSSRP